MRAFESNGKIEAFRCISKQRKEKHSKSDEAEPILRSNMLSARFETCGNNTAIRDNNHKDLLIVGESKNTKTFFVQNIEVYKGEINVSIVKEINKNNDVEFPEFLQIRGRNIVIVKRN